MPQPPRDPTVWMARLTLLLGLVGGLALSRRLYQLDWAELGLLSLLYLWIFRRELWPERFPPRVKEGRRGAGKHQREVGDVAFPSPKLRRWIGELELDPEFPFRAGQPLCLSIRGPSWGAPQVEDAHLARHRWPNVTGEARRVDSPLGTVCWSVTMQVPPHLYSPDDAANWAIDLGGQRFLLPPMLPPFPWRTVGSPLSGADAARALLDDPRPALRQVYALSDEELWERWPPSETDWWAAFHITAGELADFAVREGWAAAQVSDFIIWEGQPFLWQEGPGRWKVVVWAERGRVESRGSVTELSEGAKLLLKERYRWLPDEEPATYSGFAR